MSDVSDTSTPNAELPRAIGDAAFEFLIAMLSPLFALGATPPTFPVDFYSGEQQDLSINQGGYSINNGACCSAANSAQCKVQVISMGADVREQGSMNRSRSDSAQGAILTWYAPVRPHPRSTHGASCAHIASKAAQPLPMLARPHSLGDAVHRPRQPARAR